MPDTALNHWVNGKPATQLSILDRGLLYGQSVFETIAINHGSACLLEMHLDRLQQACKRLSIPLDLALVKKEVTLAIKAVDKAVLRLTITMGEGGRGYKNPAKPAPQRLMSLHPYPEFDDDYWSKGIVLGLSDIVLSEQPLLAGIKHGNRLEQILARTDWQEDWQEALLLDTQQRVIEATQANLFIRQQQTLLTPELNNCGVKGVMREFILQLDLQYKQQALGLDAVLEADEVFVCNSVIGLWPVKQFQNRHYQDFTSSAKLLKLMQQNEAIPTL